MAALRQVDGTSHLALEPDVLERLRDAISGAWDRAIKGDPVALVCAPALRRPLARVLASAGIALPVLAYRELPAHVTITATEVVGGV